MMTLSEALKVSGAVLFTEKGVPVAVYPPNSLQPLWVAPEK